jgi:hypothetical protein
MSAWSLLLDHPHFAVTSARGIFEIQAADLATSGF